MKTQTEPPSKIVNPKINIRNSDVVLTWASPKDNGIEINEDKSKNNDNGNSKVGLMTYHVQYCPQKNITKCEEHTTNSTYLPLSKEVKSNSMYIFTVIPINRYGMRGEAHTVYEIIPKSKY